MAYRNGVQRATVTERKVPMHDPACAARVIEQIAAKYPVAYGACDCGAHQRMIERILNDKIDAVLEHTPECATQTRIPFDAAALVEKACGRFVRGAHAGQLRGWATLEVVTEGGWQRTAEAFRGGRVVRPGQILGITISDFTGKPYLEVR
jgi:hypothetical protein